MKQLSCDVQVDVVLRCVFRPPLQAEHGGQTAAPPSTEGQHDGGEPRACRQGQQAAVGDRHLVETKVTNSAGKEE